MYVCMDVVTIWWLVCVEEMVSCCPVAKSLLKSRVDFLVKSFVKFCVKSIVRSVVEPVVKSFVKSLA